VTFGGAGGGGGGVIRRRREAHGEINTKHRWKQIRNA